MRFMPPVQINFRRSRYAQRVAYVKSLPESNLLPVVSIDARSSYGFLEPLIIGLEGQLCRPQFAVTEDNGGGGGGGGDDDVAKVALRGRIMDKRHREIIPT